MQSSKYPFFRLLLISLFIFFFPLFVRTNLELADLSCLNWLDSCNRTPPSLNLFIWAAAAIWSQSAGSDVHKPPSPSLSVLPVS